MKRTNSPWSLVLAAAVALVAGGRAEAEAYVPSVGDIRAFQEPETVLKSQPSPLSQAAAKLPRGTVVRVDQVQGAWVKVTVAQGGTGTGWVPAIKTVEPRVVLDPTRPRPLAAAGSTTSSQDLSTAGRQLLEDTKKGGRSAGQRDLTAAYTRVDQIEAANRAMTVEQVAEFARKGRLGRETP